MTYSFDIFDTCLVRKCGEPNCVFDLLAERAFIKPVPKDIKRSFVAARIAAGINSWTADQKLSDIYDSLGFEYPSLLQKQQLITLEQDIEREILCPVQEIVNLIFSLRQKGHRIVFISDMYLGAEFIKPILQKTGLLEPGDPVYVSCDVGMTKASGKLFSYIHEKEGIPYESWHHYGDNKISDIKIPQRFGIHTHKISHSYSPYQLRMKSVATLNFRLGDFMAGLSRSIALQGERSAHKDFVLDIIAPLFVSFVFRIMSDAREKGFKSLYFCARDAYPLYRIACQMREIFHEISINYLYISRESLYKGNDADKIGYFTQVGLASNSGDIAIVDMRSSGNTLRVLNDLLSRHNYAPVYGYFFEICSNKIEQRDGLSYSAELDALYLQQMNNPAVRKLPSNWYLYELFFPLNSQKRTVGYVNNGQEFVPVFEDRNNDDSALENRQDYVEWRNWAFDTYTNYYIQLGLTTHSDDIFYHIAIPQLVDFFNSPNKHYLSPLAEFYGLSPDNEMLKYVDNSLIRLPLNIIKKRTLWKRGTIFYSLPGWVARLLYKK